MEKAQWACSSKGRNGIPGRNISSWERKSDLKICPEAKTIRPKMPFRPLDEQALCVGVTITESHSLVYALTPNGTRIHTHGQVFWYL